jgi:hypothetical protein
VLLPAIVGAAWVVKEAEPGYNNLEGSLSFTPIGAKAGRVFFEQFAATSRDDYAFCPLQEGAAGVPKSNLFLYGDEMVCYTWSLFRRKMKRLHE